jgi:hypothetical protein
MLKFDMYPLSNEIEFISLRYQIDIKHQLNKTYHYGE